MDIANMGIKLSDDLLTAILNTKLFCNNEKIKAEIIELNDAGNIFAIKQLISSHANEAFINVIFNINVTKIDTPDEFEDLHSEFFEQYNELLKRIDAELNVEPPVNSSKPTNNDEPNGPNL